MLAFAWGSMLVGALLLYAGWEGKSIPRMLLGDNQTQASTPTGEPRVPLGRGATQTFAQATQAEIGRLGGVVGTILPGAAVPEVHPPTGDPIPGNRKRAASVTDLDVSGGWGVSWSGPGTYEARKFNPTTAGGHSDTRWVKVGP